jgi:hypothetical protein
MLKFFRSIRKKLIYHPSKGRTGDNVRKLASPSCMYLLYAIGEILVMVIGKPCPVRDNIWVETMESPKTHRAVRYGICINPDMGHKPYGVPTARCIRGYTLFLPICSPSGTGIIRRIESSLQMIKSKLNNNEPAYHATLKQ